MTLVACASAPAAKAPAPLGASVPPSASARATAPRASAADKAQAPQAVQPDERTRKFQRAEALYLSGHLKEAATAFEELTRAYPQDGQVWFRYGNTQAKLGAYGEAARAFETSLSVDPGQGPAALNLALIRLAQAQESLGVAVAGLPAESPEGQQAQALKGQLDAFVGNPLRGSSPPAH